ncbi:Ferritin heavy chain [Myotis brandtii]|uniref:Ferritin n=1 Tax=Myotis brandtii TaxID=109478 RepID=S7NN65_MYOBR|nr:PREDICTED: ferritin heavy chain [Myotis brandtii]EPQ19099.1 Ferritin heavy chain [Myotis brandtii]
MTTPPRRSQALDSYHPACEAAVNHQIHLELYVIYVYKSMATYFEENQVTLKYVGKFFLGQAAQMKEHADRLIRLQNQRSGQTRVYNGNIDTPDYNYWDSGLKALEHALDLAMNVNQNLLHIHQLAVAKNDARLSDFLEHNCVHDQVKSIKELRDHISNFPVFPSTSEDSLAENLLDKLSLNDKKN